MRALLFIVVLSAIPGFSHADDVVSCMKDVSNVQAWINRDFLKIAGDPQSFKDSQELFSACFQFEQCGAAGGVHSKPIGLIGIRQIGDHKEKFGDREVMVRGTSFNYVQVNNNSSDFSITDEKIIGGGTQSALDYGGYGSDFALFNGKGKSYLFRCDPKNLQSLVRTTIEISWDGLKRSEGKTPILQKEQFYSPYTPDAAGKVSALRKYCTSAHYIGNCD